MAKVSGYFMIRSHAKDNYSESLITEEASLMKVSLKKVLKMVKGF